MKPLSNNELSMFCGQMAMILRSGISSTEGLSLMAEDSPEQGKELLESLISNMEETGIFHQSIRDTEVFPEYMCNMIQIGEESGRLDEVMSALSEHYEQQETISRSIKNAVTYPFIMITMMLAVILVLIVKVMPVFNQVYKQLGTGLTGVSKNILNMGILINRYAFVLVLLAVVLAGCFLYFAFTEKGRAQFFRLSSKLPFTQKFSEKIAVSRFASGMYLALESGLDTDESLEMAARLAEHPVLEEKITKTRTLLEEGQGFSEAVSESQIFDSLSNRMISIGFKTGAVDEAMKQISLQYAEDVNERIFQLISRLEPTLVAVLSIIVGLILLSVMLPLMGIMSGMG